MSQSLGLWDSYITGKISELLWNVNTGYTLKYFVNCKARAYDAIFIWSKNKIRQMKILRTFRFVCFTTLCSNVFIWIDFLRIRSKSEWTSHWVSIPHTSSPICFLTHSGLCLVTQNTGCLSSRGSFWVSCQINCQNSMCFFFYKITQRIKMFLIKWSLTIPFKGKHFPV